MSFAPEWSASASATYEWDLTGDLAALAGQPFGPWLRRASDLAARRSGYALSREEVLP